MSTRTGIIRNNTSYLYRADGVKLKKTYKYAPYNPLGTITKLSTEETDYLDGFQYSIGLLESPKGGSTSITTLQFYPTSEGYYDFIKNKYIYNYTDHLGNVRLSYFNNGSGVEVLEENNYYPFGLKHDGYNPTVGNSAYQYKYNGKELQTDSGMYDYGARFYMPDLGRWGVVDPLAETTLHPYSYADNNPIFYNNPTGMIAQQPEMHSTIYKHKRTGEEVNVNDGVNETVLVNGHDFAKAKTYAKYYNSVTASLNDKNTNYEVNQGYIDFYYSTRYGDGFSFASLLDSGPDKRRMPTSDSDTMILLEMPDIGRKGAAKGLLRGLARAKSANLPAWKTILIDIEHIASGHMKGGSRVSSLKTMFPDNLSERQVENLVREAYRNSKKIKTQGERVLLRGNNIEMWVNTQTKTIETAYPIVR